MDHSGGRSFKTRFRVFLTAPITWGKTVNMEPKIQLYTQETILEIFKVVYVFIMALLFTSLGNIVNCYHRQRRAYHLHVYLHAADEGSISTEILVPTYSVNYSHYSDNQNVFWIEFGTLYNYILCLIRYSKRKPHIYVGTSGTDRRCI